MTVTTPPRPASRTGARLRPRPGRSRADRSRSRRRPGRALPPRRTAPPPPSLLPVPERGRRRVGIVLAIWLVVSLAIGWRLVSLQVRSADELATLAARQTERDLEVPASRGRIYDRELAPLATSVTSVSVYAHPRQIAEAGPGTLADVATRLSDVLDQPISEIATALQEDASFVYLGRQLDLEVEDQVRDLRLPGVGTLREPRREYPNGITGSQLVGVAGVDDVGLSGLESRHDDLLRGTPGRVRIEQGNEGLTIGAAPEELVPAMPGTDLVLTIDRHLQHAAERILAEAVERHDADGGSAVVLDVDDGDVLAAASVPQRSASGQAARLRALTDAYEPGSVGKVITAAAALEDELVRPSSTFVVPDSYEVAGRTYSDSHSHETETMTVTEIVADSSNVGTIMLAERIGAEPLDEWIRRFGLGAATGIGFPGEATGYVPAVEDWSSSSLPTLAIGQGLSASTLQLASVYATVAAGGERVEPRLVLGTVGGDGRMEQAPVSPRQRVITPQTATELTRMLETAVADGTGGNAQIDGYRIAGKTGTAQKAWDDRRGYEPGAYIASFAGFAPVTDPEVAVVVSLDEPRNGYYGGTVAAPAFAELTAAVLSSRRVPTDADEVVRPPGSSPGGA